jgi:hypothetical protein
VSALVVAQPHLVVPAAVLVLLAVVGLDPRPALAAAVYAAAEIAGRAQPVTAAFS